jgi:hypothetical protein
VLAYALLGVLGMVLIAAAMRARRPSVRLDQRSWGELVSSLKPVEFDHVRSVAQDFLEPREGQITLEPPDMWLMLGGRDGLRRMRKNAELMLMLAAHAQRWNFDEGVIVTERIRRDGVRLENSIRRVEMALLFHSLMRRSTTLIPFHLHEAASSYYLMRQRLLALYQTSHSGLYPRLAQIL